MLFNYLQCFLIDQQQDYVDSFETQRLRPSHVVVHHREQKKTLLVWHIVKRDLRTDSVGNISLKAPLARVGIAMTNPEHRLTD